MTLYHYIIGGDNENRPWVRIASSVLASSNGRVMNPSTLEAMRTQGSSKEPSCRVATP
jgi:hypothetical protein